MNKLIESIYLFGLPLAVIVGLAGIFRRPMRKKFLTLLFVLLGAWAFSLSKLQARSTRIEKCPMTTTGEVVKVLGDADIVHSYPEGDEDWVYLVRVWPWEAGIVLNVNGHRVLGGGRIQNVGLFFSPEFPVRSVSESKRVKEFLTLNQNK